MMKIRKYTVVNWWWNL